MNNHSYVIKNYNIKQRGEKMKKETLVCECTVIHQEVIDKIKLVLVDHL